MCPAEDLPFLRPALDLGPGPCCCWPWLSAQGVDTISGSLHASKKCFESDLRKSSRRLVHSMHTSMRQAWSPCLAR